jgi:hypothetical protein
MRQSNSLKVILQGMLPGNRPGKYDEGVTIVYHKIWEIFNC